MKYLIRQQEITARDGDKYRVPLRAIALMYKLEPADCIVYGSDKHADMTEAERQSLHHIPGPCMGLYCRWLGIQEDFKAGIDSEDTRALRELLQRKQK
jgi:hypothetical protein